MIGTRDPNKIDVEKVFEVAKATGTALEINSQQQRMDMNDELAMNAREKGITMVISTDSYDLGQFAYMKLDVALARWAWCRTSDILNTYSWK